MKLHDYFPRDWWPSSSSADDTDRPGSAPLPPQPAELDTGPGRPSPSLRELLELPSYKGVPVQEVDELEPERPLGEAYSAFRALGEAEHQRNLNRRATAALEVVNRRRIELDQARLREQQRAVEEGVVDVVDVVGLQPLDPQALTNCSPGRHEMFVMRSRRSLRREHHQTMLMGAVLGASAGAFIVSLLISVFG